MNNQRTRSAIQSARSLLQILENEHHEENDKIFDSLNALIEGVTLIQQGYCDQVIHV
jgi:hypothetical protein